MSHTQRNIMSIYLHCRRQRCVSFLWHNTRLITLISSDEKKSKWKFFTFWQFVFARWSSLQACWAFRINLRILHIYFPNRIHNSKVSFNFSRQPDFSFVVFPLQDIHIRKIIWLVKRSVTSHGNSPKWNPACP